MKKASRYFRSKNGHFFLKGSFEKLVRESFFRPPKLGAKSPPMVVFIYLFICSGYFYSASSSPLLLTLRGVWEFHAKAPQATLGEGLAQGRPTYVVARAGFEPMTLRTKGDEYTTEPPRPTCRLRRPINGT